MTYCRENESANLNTLGQGPAAYKVHLIDRIRFGEANKFTIPRVSTHPVLRVINIYFNILGVKKDYFET